jgi:type VI secretion system secreted protein VgrG
MGQITQDNRSISISDFSLGKDTLLLSAFTGSETISDLFQFNIEVLSENLELMAIDIVGKPGTITVHSREKRFINGFISHFSFSEIKANNLRQYKLTMVPWLWFLTKTNNHRIFQDKTTKDIVSKVFKDIGFTDFNFKAEGGKSREYCIQHNESDFHFISRLLEEEGIAYYFKHSDGKHMMMLVDRRNAYEECLETDLEYSKGSFSQTQIHYWQHDYKFQKGEWTINDYEFKEPNKNLTANSKSKSKFANNAKFQHYQYPDLYDKTIGKNLVDIRMESEEVALNTVNAASNCSSFYAGGKFKLAKHTTKNEKGSYIITSINHQAEDTSYYAGGDKLSGYKNTFNCIPADVHYRPVQRHLRPEMKGPQSAIVVGPKSEEIYIDKFGRIKVQFIWDREGKKDENSSCFIRVMQSWAGNQWGSSFIPRIGHEVIVSFLDGDPDRPIVTGSVYNGINKPTYKSKTQSGIKTRSTKDGTSENFNELRFEDKKGSEQIYIHAEKNLDTRVENDETLTIDNDRTKLIKHDENSTIENDRNKTVNNNQTESIIKNKIIDVGENHTENIKKNKIQDVGENQTVNIGKKFSLTAGDEISLTTGSSSIVMKSDGTITINGVDISVTGTGEINLKAAKNIVMKGKKILGN